MDRRTQRTRDALRSAFVKLVLSRGYEAVSVGEICDTAKVGRSTFYSHYKSKTHMLQESLQRPSSGLAACVATDAEPQALLSLLAHFREQTRFNRVFFEQPVRSIWVSTLARVIQARLPRGRRSALQALLVAELQIALISHWLSGRFSLKPEAVAALLITNTQTLLANQ